MSKLKPCPFCSGLLVELGHMIDYETNKVVMSYQHPELSQEINRCPLTRLVFTEKTWNARIIEDTLQARNTELNDALNIASKRHNADAKRIAELETALHEAISTMYLWPQTCEVADKISGEIFPESAIGEA